MKKVALLAAAALTLASFSGTALAKEKKGGDALFKEKCASCHPDGGNIVNPAKTLKGIKDPREVVKKIRMGGGGMTAFDQKAISDPDARAIATYVVKTFKK